MNTCPTCSAQFISRRAAKRYCSFDCYVKSDEWAARNAAQCNRVTSQCLECGIDIVSKASNKRRFCSQIHYRAYMDKRFDRNVATTSELHDLQNYDEFLVSDELPCLVKGCDWRGHSLSHHMNFSHGMTSREFKEAAGFNFGTGVVSRILHEAMVGRVGTGWQPGAPLPPPPGAPIKRSPSREGLEHLKKGRADFHVGLSPRDCRGCGTAFTPRPNATISLYCSTGCRDSYYLRRKRAHSFSLNCVTCQASFLGTAQQARAASRGDPTVCSNKCRGTLNTQKSKHVMAARAKTLREQG